MCPSMVETAMSLLDTVEAEVRGYTPMSEYNHTMEVCAITLQFLEPKLIINFYRQATGNLAQV